MYAEGEVQPQPPEAEQDDGEKMLCVDYSRCVTLLWRTNQDLLARVQALEKLVKSKG